jgi:hypothetical protein
MTQPGDSKQLKMGRVDKIIKETIKVHKIYNWLRDYPWLKGYIGERNFPIWFVAENPSLRGVKRVHDKNKIVSDNLQWNAHAGDWLFREALVKAGFKMGDPRDGEGWKCYITDIIKEPEIVKDRNLKKSNSSYWKSQAMTWLPVFLEEIRLGRPEVFVAVGNQTRVILEFLRKKGVSLPRIDQIQHYSYIMFRPDNKTGLGPGHDKRKRDFITSVRRIKKLYAPDL